MLIDSFISEVMGKTEDDLEAGFDLDLEQFDEIVEGAFKLCLSKKTLSDAREAQDERKSQFLLRMRDFATVVKCKRAMSDGDVG